MVDAILVLAGPAGSGKTSRLLQRYRRALADQPPGGALWLSPTHRSSLAARRRILSGELSGCWQPQCLTFGQVARRIVETAPVRMRPVSLSQQRLILKQLIETERSQKRLRHFWPIAQTPGFLELVVRFIRELKRLEVWPEELTSAYGPRLTAKEHDLNLLYAGYQEILTRHDLYDREGQFWSARELLKQGFWGPFAPVRHVFVDGFADFTRTEREILQILAARAESMAVTLPLDLGDAREELFARSAKTLAELRAAHQDVVVESVERRAGHWPSMDHLERALFQESETETDREASGIEIVASADARGEIEQIARRIKQLLVRQSPPAARPDEILVVFRSLGESAELVRQVFEQFGIPAAVADQPALATAPIVSALVAWLRLAVEDWPYGQVLALIARSDFQPRWREWNRGRLAAARRIHEFQIPFGRDQLIAQLESSVERSSAEDDALRDETTRALALVRRIAQALDALPKRATLADWAVVLERFAHQIDLVPPARAGDTASAADRSAWGQLLAALAGCARVESWIGRSEEVSLGDFCHCLLDVAGCETLPSENDEEGRVRVLSAEAARGLSAPYVFLAGLSEKAFPPPTREDCMHGEAQTRRLVAAGLPLVPQAQRSRHEMLLFYELTTRATRQLVLSYPALDASAQPISPSPFVTAVERAFGSRGVPRDEQPDLSCVPPTDDVYCPRDFRVRAVQQAIAGETGLLGDWCRDGSNHSVASHVLAALRATSSRQQGQSYGAFEGMFTSQAARDVLAERYSSAHCWSPSELEQYANCPFQFLLARVMNLEPPDEWSLSADRMRRGRILHGLLATLHRQLNQQQRGGCSPVERPQDELLAEIERLLDELGKSERGSRALDRGLLEIDYRRARDVLTDYHRQHSRYDSMSDHVRASIRPAHFEVSFGPKSRRPSAGDQSEDEPRDPLSSSDPFELQCAGETIRFAGRIDRIDVGTLEGQTVFNVVDYKSSRSAKTTSKAVEEGIALQLPIYALAAQALLADMGAVPLSAGYWNLSGGGYQDPVRFHLGRDGQLALDPNWEATRDGLRRRVRALVEGVWRGDFPMHSLDDKCTSYCAFRTLCRVNQARALGKSWQPSEECAG